MRIQSLLVCAVAVIGACGSPARDVVGNPGVPATIELIRSSTTSMTSRGDTQTVVAIARDDRQEILSPPSVTWSSSSPVVASVSGTGNVGNVVAVGDGTATITATVGSITASFAVTVHRVIGSVQLTAPSPTLVYGSSMPLTATARDARGNAIDGITGFTFTTDNPASFDVAPDGVVTALLQVPQLPNATLTASITRDGVTRSGSTPVTVVLPTTFDRAALLLSDYVVPVRVPTLAAGAAFFSRVTDAIDYRVTWSAMSGGATHVQIRGPGGARDIADVLVDLDLPTQTKTHGTVLGLIRATHIHSQGGRAPISLDSLAVLLCNTTAYVEVSSAAFPLGEIRGQSQCVP